MTRATHNAISSRKAGLVTALSCVVVASTVMAAEIVIPPSTVGLPVELTDVVLPGAEVEPVPLDDETPVVIRVDAVSPHGTDHRYDLVISALEPGTFDLRDYLRRKDGTAADDLPPLQFTVQALLPPGQIEPHRPAAARLPWLGGYRILMAVTGVLWVAVMGWLLWPRRRRAAASDESDNAVPQSFADRLRPLVSKARNGDASAVELAELERAVVEYWRRRIGLTDVPPTDVIARLRSHPEAAPLLLQLEEWLHRPDANGRDVDVNKLLAPYADSPTNAADDERATIQGAAGRHSETGVHAK